MRKSCCGPNWMCSKHHAEAMKFIGNPQEGVTLSVNKTWRSDRVEDDDGEIFYEAHGPKESYVRFEGPNAVSDCRIFMKAVGYPNE